MLIWGSSSTNLKQRTLVTGSCTACGHTEFVLHAIQRYGHLWWIPFIPFNKIFFLTCLNCESSISNDNVKNFIQDIDPKFFKTPIWLYVGWLALFCLALFIFIPAEMREKNVDQPKNYVVKNTNESINKNDFLVLHDEKELGYVLVRILKVEDKNVSFQMSKYLYKQLSKLNSLVQTSQEIFKDDFYHEDYLEGTLEDIKKEFQLKNIVSRNDNPRL